MDKKLTFFELHFDGAKIGGLRSLRGLRTDDDTEDAGISAADERTIDSVDEITEAEGSAIDGDETDEASGRSVGRFLGLLAGVAVLGMAVRTLRRRRGGEDADAFDLDESDVESEEIGIER